MRGKRNYSPGYRYSFLGGGGGEGGGGGGEGEGVKSGIRKFWDLGIIQIF